jgi:hypothetical protein
MVAQGVKECGPRHEVKRAANAIDDKIDRNAVGNLVCGIGHVVSPAMEAEPRSLPCGRECASPPLANSPTGGQPLGSMRGILLPARKPSALRLAEHRHPRRAVDDLAGSFSFALVAQIGKRFRRA